MERSVETIRNSSRSLEGGGFPVARPFPTSALSYFDPFLLLDEMGPVDWPPGRAIGAPDHPHRGFETVTYLLSGSMEHRDSHGNHGVLRPGDVQWMTAGGGVIHSEMPAEDFNATGGRMHGFQLWVNLPKSDKMMRPRYQDVASERIPVARFEGGTVKVIAGESHGASAVIDTRIPITFLHVNLEPGAAFRQPVAKECNAFVFVIAGSGTFGEGKAGDADAVFYRNDGDEIAFTAGAEGLEALLLAGRPLNESVARYGPFVMNTQAEIMQAVRDYQSGKFGEIPATGLRAASGSSDE